VTQSYIQPTPMQEAGDDFQNFKMPDAQYSIARCGMPLPMAQHAQSVPNSSQTLAADKDCGCHHI
jgi:hypothetical protein